MSVSVLSLALYAILHHIKDESAFYQFDWLSIEDRLACSQEDFLLVCFDDKW